MRTLDIAFFLSLSITLLRVFDLFILPTQQKWIQNKTELFTLWLSYKNPLLWCKKVIEHWFIQIFSTVIFVLGIVPLIFVKEDINDTLDTVWSLVLLIFSTITLVYLVYQWLNKEKILIYTWLFRNQTVTSFITKFIIITSIIYLYVFAMGREFNQVEYLKTENLFKEISFNSMHAIVIPVALVIYSLVTVPSLVVLLAYLFFVMLWLSIRILEFIMWRITLYSKGATVAIATVVTLVLCVLEVFMKKG